MSDKAIFLASIFYAPYLAGGVGFGHTQYNAPFGINEFGSFPARAHGAVDVAQCVRGAVARVFCDHCIVSIERIALGFSSPPPPYAARLMATELMLN